MCYHHRDYTFHFWSLRVNNVQICHFFQKATSQFGRLLFGVGVHVFPLIYAVEVNASLTNYPHVIGMSTPNSEVFLTAGQVGVGICRPKGTLFQP